MSNRFGSYIDLTIDTTGYRRIRTLNGHTTVPRYLVPASPVASDVVKAKGGEPGLIPFPGRAVRVMHPAGGAIEAITAGTVTFTANPVCRYNPVLNEVSDHTYPDDE